MATLAELEVIIGAKIDPSMAAKLKKIGIGFDDLKQKSLGARSALVDVTRVVQDAPFGIGNNVEQLSMSFTRLVQETGSAGGALKALLGSLTGAGGIAFAVSAITTALTFAQVGFGAWTRKSKEAKEAGDDLAKTLKELIKPIDDVGAGAAGSVSGQVEAVRSLAAILTDANKPLQERKRALEELKETNKAYFGDLDLEKSKVQDVTKATNEYINAIVAQAVLKSFEEEISKVGIELFKHKKALDAAKESNDFFRQSIKDQPSAFKAATIGIAQSQGALTKETETVKTLQRQYDLLKLSVNGAIEETLKFKDLNPQSGGTAKTEKVKLRPLGFEFVDFDPEAALKRLVDADLGNKKTEIEFEARLKPKISISPINIADITSPLEKALAQLRLKLADDMLDLVKGTFTDAFTALGEAIGNTLAGGGLGKALEAFGNVIASAVISLGKMLIQFGILSKTVKVALASIFTNPLAAIAAGVGLVAFGSLVKSKLSHGVGMAEGGIVPGGFPNDTFPARLTSGEAVIPLNRMNQFMGGGERLVAEVNMDKLIFALIRKNNQQGRFF